MDGAGASGSVMGGKPEPDVHLEEGKPVPLETLQRVTNNTMGQIEKLNKEETLRQLKEENLAAEGVFSSARAKMVNIGYLMGCLLVHLKKLVIAEDENWGEYISREFPEMSRRTRDKCMERMGIAHKPTLKHYVLRLISDDRTFYDVKGLYLKSSSRPYVNKKGVVCFNIHKVDLGELELKEGDEFAITAEDGRIILTVI